jgi:hypothetical protein
MPHQDTLCPHDLFSIHACGLEITSEGFLIRSDSWPHLEVTPGMNSVFVPQGALQATPPLGKA